MINSRRRTSLEQTDDKQKQKQKPERIYMPIVSLPTPDSSVARVLRV